MNIQEQIKPSHLSLLIQDCPNCGQEVNREFVDELTVRIKKEAIKSILESLVEREEVILLNTPDEVAELNKELPSTIQRQAYNNAIGYTEAKQDTISYLQSLIKSLNEK